MSGFTRIMSDQDFSQLSQEEQNQLLEIEKQWTPTGLCQKCNKHQATEVFAQDSLALTHGWMQYLCKCCVLETQIEYRKRNPMPTLEELELQYTEALKTCR